MTENVMLGSVNHAVRRSRASDRLRSCRPSADAQVLRGYAEPLFFSVSTETGEVVAAELFDRAEALELARAEEGRVAWAHGRHPHVVGFVRWRIA